VNKLRGIGVALAIILALVGSSSAQQLYITNEGSADIQLWNITTNELSTIYTIGVGKEYNPDDLTLNAAGQLLYSVPNAGTVGLFDPKTGVNKVLASGIASARDLEIEPGGNSVLVAKYADPAEIIRITFANPSAWTVLVPKAAKLGTCDGLAYDNYGNLYAVSDHNNIVQINPATGAIIATLVLEPHSGINGGDGLTFDAYTDSLWGTHDGKNLGTGLIEIPVSKTGFTAAGYKFYPLPGIGNVDGIKSDGKGDLYIGAIFNAIVYNIPSQTITHSIVVKGADGVSLVPGTY
jgi:WD40 repeat protein